MHIERWPGRSAGRSRATGFGGLVWLVANGTDPAAHFQAQAAEALAGLDDSLRAAGSDRSRLLSVQVLLKDMRDRPAFDELWREWIGPDPAGWPQRSCVEVGLAPGLLVEITAVAAREAIP
jgi:enamine deaminase RidA (YjgF/YER057c/UK114 family)